TTLFRSELDGGGGGDAVVETDRVADRLTDRLTQLLRDALGDGPGRQTTGLRVADESAAAAAQVEADLRDLGRLTGTGLTGDDDDLVVLDRLRDILAARRHRQRLRVGDLRHADVDQLPLLDGAVDILRDRLQRLRGAGAVEATSESTFIGEGDVTEQFIQCVPGDRGRRSVSHG